MNDAGSVKFIVLTTQRSGATFFIKCLASHPKIACRHETVFSQVNRFKFFSFDRPTSFYYQYRSSSLGRQLAHRFSRRSLVYDCIDDYFCTLPSSSKAIGFKLSYNHVRKYPEIADWITDHDVRIVHFVRTNVLRTILSLATAKKRGVYHATQEVEPVRVHLDPRKLLRDLTRRTRLIEMYRTRFAEKLYLEVSYESFVGDRDAQTRRILPFLGIDEFVHLDTDLVKLNPVSIKDMLENYDSVVRTLEGTVFEKYLTM